MAAHARTAFANDSGPSTSESRRSSRTISTIRRPVRWARTERRESAAGKSPFRGNVTPIASTRHAIVDAVPIVLQNPLLRDIPDSAARNSSRVMSPARTASERRHTSVPLPMGAALIPAVQLRAAREDDGRQVDARRTHQLGGGVLVASAEQHDAVDRVAPDRLLDGHAHEIPEEHRRRQHLGLSERHRREDEWNAPGLPHTPLHVVRQVVEVAVAGSQVGCARADPDHGPP